MKKLFNRERVIALVCLAFAAFIWFQAGTFPESFIDTVGPSKYPRLLAALIAVPSVVLLVTSNGPAEPIKGGREFKSFFYLVLCIVVYLALFNLIGFVLATTAFLLALTLYFDRRELKTRLKIAVPYSAGVSLLLYFFFARLLGVLLPSLIL